MFSKEPNNTRNQKKPTHLVEELCAQGVKKESLATAACCVLVMWSILHVVKSSGKGGLQEASVEGRAFSYVNTKALLTFLKVFGDQTFSVKTHFRKLSCNACYQNKIPVLVGEHC